MYCILYIYVRCTMCISSYKHMNLEIKYRVNPSVDTRGCDTVSQPIVQQAGIEQTDRGVRGSVPGLLAPA